MSFVSNLVSNHLTFLYFINATYTYTKKLRNELIIYYLLISGKYLLFKVWNYEQDNNIVIIFMWNLVFLYNKKIYY